MRKLVSNKKVYESSSSKRSNPSNVNVKPKKSQLIHNLSIWFGLTGVAVVSAAAGALLAVSMSATSPLQQAQLTPEEKAVFSQDEAVAANTLQVPELKRPLNVLVTGIKVITSDLKERPQEDLGYHALVNSFEGLADTMLLLRFDPENEKVTVLSIPRDTRVYMEGYGYQKINIANYRGGPALTAETTSKLLNGVTIDRYIRVNVQGIEKLIDALGGIDVYVPKDMKYNDFSQHLYINLKKGQQRLDGNKAVQFLRFRYDRYGDISRVQRQQLLMRAVTEQALKPSTLIRIPKILSTIQSNLDTNLTVKELMALSGFATKTDESNIQMLIVPGDFGTDERTGASYWVPSDRGIKQVMTQHFDVKPIEADYNSEEPNLEQNEYIEPAHVRVAIQDSTEDPEAVQAMVKHLQEAGYGRIFIGEQWGQPLQETKIVAQKGDDGTASALRASIGIGKVVVESTGELNSDVTIQLGKDWKKFSDRTKTEE